jgi:hypothetical protein
VLYAMKIAYFIMIHHMFSQFCWLFDAVYTEDDIFLIHVDKKADKDFYDQVKSYAGSRTNVRFLPQRAITRFGWSVVSVELEAIRILANCTAQWKYFINLSGQDYPIKSLACIKDRLRAEYPRNFIDVISFDEAAKLDAEDPHPNRILSFEVFGRIAKTPLQLPFPRSIDIRYKGPAWFIFARDFCKWLLSEPITKRLATLVKYTWNPDELFFQSLIMNSPYRNSRTDQSGREMIWIAGSASPKILRIEDYERLSMSPALFARKFDESVDRQILINLAYDHGFLESHRLSP